MISATRLFDLAVSFVACGILGYFVDILNLPLRAGRTEILHLIVMGFVLLAASVDPRTGVHIGFWRPRHLGLVLILCFLAATEYLRLRGASYIVLYQFLVFAAVAIYVEKRVERGEAREFLYVFLLVANGYMLVLEAGALSADYIGGWFQADELTFRNAPPYLALLGFCLISLCDRPWLRRWTVFNAIALPLLNHTRGAIGLFAILLCFLAAERLLQGAPRFRRAMFFGAFGIALVWPLLVYAALQSYVTVDDVRAIENTRQVIDPEVGAFSSAIIRIMSNIALLEAYAGGNWFLGLGMAEAGETKIWSYYSHSLLIVLIGGWGVVGLALSIFLVKKAYELRHDSRILALLVVFVYSVTNDLYAWIAIAYAMHHQFHAMPSKGTVPSSRPATPLGTYAG